MAFDFPASPTVGQEYTSGGNTYVWNGYGWTLKAASGAASITISDTPPSSPSAGAVWWESDSGGLYIYYNDGNTSQWVQINGMVPPNPITISTSAPSGGNDGDIWYVVP